MLLTQLLSEHPEAIIDIVRQTPTWVGALLAALLWLGFSATRDRDAPILRLVLLPVAMTGLALWGVESAFSATGHLAELLVLWCAGFALVLRPGLRAAVPAGTTWNADTRRFHLPGSWVPMGLILMVFLMKYGLRVQLAMEPALAHDLGFALAVTAVYGLLSGFFAARTARLLRLVRPAAPALADRA